MIYYLTCERVHMPFIVFRTTDIEHPRHTCSYGLVRKLYHTNSNEKDRRKPETLFLHPTIQQIIYNLQPSNWHVMHFHRSNISHEKVQL